ncbi:MAG: hypothetical protein M3373_12580 [Gemmatimonadota bacterium]|nr:hypothetical protein [Gemmatimonadota bacterium]
MRRSSAAPLRTVLVFAHECAPYHRPESTIGAQRPAQFAKHLPALGWRAIVLCRDREAEGAGWSDADAARIRGLLRDGDPADSIVIPTPSSAWDGWLDRAWRWAARDGGAKRRRAAVRKPLTIAKLFTGDYSQSWQPCARRAAEIVMRQVHVDACIGEHSPDAGIFLARWFTDGYSLPWVADFRDPLLLAIPRPIRPAYLRFVRRLLSTAAATVNVTPYWTALDARAFGRPSVCIPNGFDPAEYSPGVTPPSDRLTMAFIGNIWPQMQPSIFFDGLARLRGQVEADVFARLRVVARGTSAPWITACARSAGVLDVVDVGSHIERRQALALMQQAHVLLLLSITDRERHDPLLSAGIYPGKTFEYFGAGRPILCVPGDGGILDALLRDTATGVSARTPEAVAAYLAAALCDWNAGRAPSYNPRTEVVAHYTRRALSGQLAELLNRSVTNWAGGGRSEGVERTDPLAASHRAPATV